MKLTKSELRLIIKEELTKLSEQEAIEYLEHVFANSHASGRPIGEQFKDKILAKEAMEIAVDIVNSLTPAVLSAIIERYAKMRKKSEKIEGVSSIQEMAVINSIILYTGGNVASVRNPNEFIPDQAKEVSLLHTNPYQDNLSIMNDVIPDKDMYIIANYVMTQLANLPIKSPITVYRGIALPNRIAQNIRVGSTFLNKQLSSWTSDESQAINFGKGRAVEMMYSYSNNKLVATDSKEMAVCIFKVDNFSVGADISHLSVYPGEKEFICGRKVMIKKIKGSWFSRKPQQIILYPGSKNEKNLNLYYFICKDAGS